MQVKKDSVRQAMLDNARQEFFTQGFTNTSMHTIAAKANVAVGNLYRYYKNKADLFEAVVRPAYDRTIELVLLHRPDEHVDQELSASELMRGQLQNLTSLLLENRIELLILIDQSTGTRFINTKGALAGAINQQLKNALVQAKKPGNKDYIDVVIRSLSVGLVEGMLDIIRAYKLPSMIRKTADLYIKLFREGINALVD